MSNAGMPALSQGSSRESADSNAIALNTAFDNSSPEASGYRETLFAPGSAPRNPLSSASPRTPATAAAEKIVQAPNNDLPGGPGKQPPSQRDSRVNNALMISLSIILGVYAGLAKGISAAIFGALALIPGIAVVGTVMAGLIARSALRNSPGTATSRKIMLASLLGGAISFLGGVTAAAWYSYHISSTTAAVTLGLAGLITRLAQIVFVGKKRG